MAAAHLIKARVSSEMKERVHALAEQQLLNESIWLRRLVQSALENAATQDVTSQTHRSPRSFAEVDVLGDSSEPATSRVCIRLRPEDRLLLRERSRARGLASATYVSVLVRSHLRHLTPLPKDELRALKRSVAELSAIGRNLNQIAKAANQGQHVSVRGDELRSLLKACEALRQHVAGMILRNTESWETGHVRVQD